MKQREVVNIQEIEEYLNERDIPCANHKRLLCSLACNLAVAVMEMTAAVMSWRRHGAGMFLYYTEDSNLFTLVVCAVCSAGIVYALVKKKELPRWMLTLKYIAACCLALTFIVVVCVLAPMIGGLEGYKIMLLSDSMLFMHLLCPLLVLFSFLFIDEGTLPRRAALYALIPTALYAAIAVALNICGIISGPYPFLMVYEQPLWASVLWGAGILGGSYLFALLLARIKKGRQSFR
ncbi:MAG: hypothetical protein Q4B42_02030 [Oscillospiraceae bacterium]|nr:hypothetical protein [Oscillospiraceae bacterium]